MERNIEQSELVQNILMCAQEPGQQAAGRQLFTYTHLESQRLKCSWLEGPTHLESHRLGSADDLADTEHRGFAGGSGAVPH